MIRMFVRHKVTDFDHWKQGYDAFDEERKGMGVVGDAVYRSVVDTNEVTAWHDFSTLEEAQAFVGSPRLREVMDEAGVASDPDIWFTESA